MIRKLADSDHLCTPEWILDVVRRMGVIACDPCSNPKSTVGAVFTLSLENGDDGLQSSWTDYCHSAAVGGSGLAWINPPYSRGHLLPWARKIRSEAAQGCEIISLLPHDCTTEWWDIMATSSQAHVDVSKRVAFVGGQHQCGMIRSAIFYHGPRKYLFAHHFSEIGRVYI